MLSPQAEPSPQAAAASAEKRRRRGSFRRPETPLVEQLRHDPYADVNAFGNHVKESEGDDEPAERREPLPGETVVADADRAKRRSHLVRMEDAALDQMRSTSLLPGLVDTARYSEAQRLALQQYESIDYWEPNTLMCKASKDSDSGSEARVDMFRWFITAGVGLIIGVWSFIIFQSVSRLSHERRHIVETIIHDHGLGAGYGVMLAWAVGFGLASTVVCIAVPTAAGSGVPDVMAYLNGVVTPKMFNGRTLVAKTLSVICAVVSGLPVGSEGPMIHIGALVGAGMHTGRSRVLPCAGCAPGLFTALRTTRDHRDFITMGAAAGVTAAFSAPIGGMLFVMEEVASYFPVSLAWQVFVCCFSATLGLQVLTNYSDGWTGRSRGSGVGSGDLVPSAVVLYQGSAIEQIPMSIYAIIPAILLGAATGVLGAVFTKANMLLAALRMTYRTATWQKTLEVLAVTIVWTTVAFWLPTGWGCETDAPHLHNSTHISEALHSYMCKPHGWFNQAATLSMNSSHEMLVFLFSSNTYTLLGYGPLITYFVVYFIMACLSAGTFLASGLVIPSFVIGSLGGRIMGLILIDIFGYHGWNDPGVFALCGAASFFGGMSRLTFSLTVVMMEVSGSMKHAILLMTAIWTSKFVNEWLTPTPFFQALLNLRGVPFLNHRDAEHVQRQMDNVLVRDILSNKEVEAVKAIVVMNELVSLLERSPHNAFPVASARDGTFRGLIRRAVIEKLIRFIFELNKTDMPIRHATTADLQLVDEHQWLHHDVGIPDLPEELLQCSVDLNPYVDTSAFSVTDTMSVARVHFIYRALGVRHLVVVDRCNQVAGMITRKDLLVDIVEERLREAKDKRGRNQRRRASSVMGGSAYGNDEARIMYRVPSTRKPSVDTQ